MNKKNIIIWIVLLIIAFFIVSVFAYPSVIIVSPTNISYTTNITDFNLTVTDSPTECWYSLNNGITNYTMINDSVSNFYDINSSMTEGSHTVIFYCNDTINEVNNTETQTFFIDTTAPTITFISQTPNDIMWNSTERPEILFNITDVSGINESSIVVFHGVNHSHNGYENWNWSNRALDQKAYNEWRASSRNESKWWESVIYKEFANDIWSFGGRGSDGIFVNRIDNSSTHAYYNWSEYGIHFLFPQSWYVDRSEMYKTNKTNQYIEIYKNNPVKIERNITFHDLSENFTLYPHLNIETRGADIDLISYVCNSSYSTGKVSASSDCQAGWHITGSETRTVTIVNSSYIEKVGFVKDGYFGSVAITRQMFVVLTSNEVTASERYRLYFANNTIADNTNFNETNIMWTSGNNGLSYTQYAGTPDVWYSPAQVDYDKIVYYVYACDDLGNCANSTWQTDTLQAEVNQAPFPPTIITPEEGNVTFNPFYINWTTAGDLDGDDYNATIQIYNPDGTLNRTLADDNITDDITYFNVTDLADGTYRINITLCDDSDVCSSTLSGWNFTTEHYTTDVTICRNLWEENSTYTLQNNIETTGDCFTITANNITLDLNNHNVSGGGGFWDDGVITTNYNDTTIKNGRLDKFYHQIYAGYVYRLNLTNMTFNGSVYSDIYGSTRNSTITDITGLGGLSGLWISGDYNILDNVNMSRYSSLALHIPGDYNIVKNSFSRYNTGATGYGLSVSGRYNNFTNNTIESNERYEIHLQSNSDGNRFVNNSLWNCSSLGIYACIYVDNSDNCTFDNNKINFSFGHGIIIDSGFVDSVDNLFKNTNMTNINLTAVNLTDAGGLNNTFLNFTYEDESVDIGSQLVRRWHYRAYVIDSIGTPMSSVIVSIFNSTSDNLFNLTTLVGYTNQSSLIEYVNNGGTSTYPSNYTLYATDVLGNFVNHVYNSTTNELQDVFIIPAVIGGGGAVGAESTTTQIAETEFLIELKPIYYLNNIKIPLIEKLGLYNGIAFEVVGKNLQSSERILNISITDASPQVFKDALPNNTESLRILQEKILWISEIIDTDEFEKGNVTFWIEVEGTNEATNVKSIVEDDTVLYIKNFKDSGIPFMINIGESVWEGNPAGGIFVLVFFGGFFIFMFWKYKYPKKIESWRDQEEIKREKRKQIEEGW